LEQGVGEGENPVFDSERTAYDVHSKSRFAWECKPKLALVYEKVDPKEAVNLWERYIGLAGSQPSEKDWVDVARLHLKKLKQQGN